MDSNGGDPVNPCKRRCKGLGPKNGEFETSATCSALPSPSSQHSSSSSSSTPSESSSQHGSQHSQVDQGVHMQQQQQTTDEQMQDSSAPKQDTAPLLPQQSNYPLPNHDAQAAGNLSNDYNAWASLAAVQEFNQNTAQTGPPKETNNTTNNAGGAGGNGVGIGGDGVNGSGVNVNGVIGNGTLRHNEMSSGHSLPQQYHQDPSQPIPPQTQPYPQPPTNSQNHIDQPGDQGCGVRLDGNATNGNAIYGQNGFYAMNSAGQQSTQQHFGRQASSYTQQNFGGYNQSINPHPFNNQGLQNGFAGANGIGNTFGASNGTRNYNPTQNGIGNNGAAGQSTSSSVPQFYGQRPVPGHSSNPGCQPPIPPPYHRPMHIKKERQDSFRAGTWQAGSTPPQGHGFAPSVHSKSEIKSEIKSEPNGRDSILQRPNGNGRNSGKRVIDLTADDDDDCVVIGQTRTAPPPRPPMQRNPCIRAGEVCFGMIKHAQIMAHKVPTPRNGADRFPQMWPAIPFCLCRAAEPICTLAVRALDCTRTEFGCLDVSTARGIAPLLDLKNLGLRLQPRIYPRKKVQGEVAGGDFPDGPKTIAVYINIYGAERSAGYVGNYLRDKQIVLDHPSQPDAVPILNPHDPRNAGIINTQLRQCDPYAQPYAQAPTQLIAPTPTNITTVTTKRNEPLTSDIIELLEHLERWNDLPEMEQDEKIVTNLLPHQKVGLAFMTARESDPVHDGKGGSLWVHEKSGVGDIWKHSITDDIVTKPPPPVFGGILADVMGLGKTLSILSLIASTTDKAAEYAKLPKFKGKNKNMVAPAKTTLLVAPVSTMSNWEEQIMQHTKPDSLSFYVYHGPKRETDPEVLKNYDVVITTYTIVAGEMKDGVRKNGKKTPFREMAFFRIVLDEAHTIRQQKTYIFKGISSVEGQRRWAVTGTPIQNKLGDLHALLAFVRITPFDDKVVFKEFIEQPFKDSDPICIERVRKLVDSITMRRQKDKINLPERHDVTVRLAMDPAQRELYDATMKMFENRVDMVQKAGKQGGKKLLNVLKMILAMRLICAHGRDLLGDEDIAGMTSSDAIDVDELEDKQPGMTAKQAYETFNLIKDTDGDICEMCSSKIESLPEAQSNDAKGVTIGYMTPCNHLLCKDECAAKYRAYYQDFSLDVRAPCCICSEMIRLELFELKEGGAAAVAASSNGKADRKVVKYRGPSVKSGQLIADLMVNRKEGKPDDPVKSIVFSSWTSHMDLIGRALTDNNITYVRLDGTMNFPQRKTAIARFRDDLSVEVMLISIGAGGLGLNLTCAQKVYVMEPQFNPAAEAQAIDRVHRLGQEKPVTVTRYIMEDSFEDKILELQQRKMDLANLSMSGKLADKKALTLDRFKSLSSLFK